MFQSDTPSAAPVTLSTKIEKVVHDTDDAQYDNLNNEKVSQDTRLENAHENDKNGHREEDVVL